jgi:hypothetical protein
MTDEKSAGMVRITVKLRPDQYDEVFRHVREIGSTISAFCRESMAKAMREKYDTAHGNRNTERMFRLECASPSGFATLHRRPVEDQSPRSSIISRPGKGSRWRKPSPTGNRFGYGAFPTVRRR